MRAVPFFTRFLKSQSTEAEAAETPTNRTRTGVRAGRTTKYPSDGDEFQTMKYPSDNDEGGIDI